MEKIKVAIVGAGPAGLSAAYVLAKNGIEVLVLERGKYSGSKNMMGGVLYSAALAKIIPEFYLDAPLERFVSKKKWFFLGEGNEISFEFKTDNFKPPYYNHSFVVLRAKFDDWFAKKVEEAGAVIAYETLVDDVIMENGRVVGIKIRNEEGEEDLFCDIVIAADGVNSLIAQKAGLRKDITKEAVALSVKEIIQLSEGIINERFGLKNSEGVAYEYIIPDKEGKYVGSAFLYTNKDSISLGVGFILDSLVKTGINPHDFLEEFKKQSSVAALIKDGVVKEYSSHLIFEGGYDEMPKIYCPGLMVIGEAAGLINSSIYKEGANLAIESGILSAETAINAIKLNDFGEKSLALYKKLLERSFPIKDLKKFKNFKHLFEKPEMFSRAIIALNALEEVFKCDNLPKEEHIKKARKIFFKDYSLKKIIKDAWTIFKSVRSK